MSHPLYLLNEMARIDRHRLLLPGAYVTTSGIGLSGNLLIDSLTLTPGMSAPNAVIAQGVVRPLRAGVPMQMKLDMTAQIVFGDGPCDGQDAYTVLHTIESYIVTSVIPPLRPFLDLRA